jgi:hypothetical protein
MNESRRKLDETMINTVKEALTQMGEMGQVGIMETLEARGVGSDALASHAMLIAENLGIPVSRSTGQNMKGEEE